MKEELEKLIQQAYDTGHLAAAWDDGAVENEIYFKSQEDYHAAVKSFMEKYHDKITDGTE